VPCSRVWRMVAGWCRRQRHYRNSAFRQSPTPPKRAPAAKETDSINYNPLPRGNSWQI
jgi:hypothetical protein